MNGSSKDRTDNPVIEIRLWSWFKQCSRLNRCEAGAASQYAGRLFRNVMTGFIALLVAVGLSAGAQAQTPTLPAVAPTEIYEGETLEFTLSVTRNFGLFPWTDGYNYLEPDSGGTATEGNSSDWYLADSGGNRIAQYSQSNSTPRLVTTGDGTQYYEIDFRLHARADSATESDETIRLYLHDEYDSHDNDYLTITLKDGTRPVMVTDGVTLSASALTLTELGSSSDVEKTYTVVLDTDPGADVTFTATVPAANSSEVEIKTGSGAFGSSATLTFTHGNTGNWSSAQTVTVRALNDADATNTTSFNLTHSLTVASGPYASITPDPVAVSVTDAGHGVTVSKASVSLAADGTVDYTIQLKSQPGGSVVITPTSSATARATVSGALTFTNSNWSTPQTVTVTGAGTGSATISHMVTTGTTDYPTSTTIASVTATVNAAANNTPTVANMIPDQTATVGTVLSYAFPANTFNDADNDNLTYSATKSDDTALPTWLTFTSGTRTFSGTPQAADVGTLSVKVTANDGNSGTVSDTFDIVVSHPARNLDIQVADAYEGENIVVTLTLSRAPGNVVARQRTFRVSTDVPSASNVNICISSYGCEAGSTPAAAADFFTVTGTDVVFGPSDTVKSVSLPTVTDSASEGVEVASIDILYSPGTGDLGIFTHGSTQVTGRNGFIAAPNLQETNIEVGSYGQIRDGARPVPITITEAGGTTVSEDGSTTTDSYTVVLDSQPRASVTVSATAGTGAQVQGPGGTAGGAATLTFTTTNWNQAQTITVTGVDDDIDNTGDARTVTIAHAASSTDSTYTIANAGEVSVTVTDDDTAGLVFSPDPVSVNEGETGSYTVALASEPSGNVTVTITGQGGSTDLTLDTDSVMAGDQDTLTFTTSNWSAAQTVELTAAEDNDSNNDSITLAHVPTGGSYGNAQNKNLAVTITDDEGLTPVISMSLPSGESEMYTDDDELIRPESEGGTGVLFTVSADRPLPSTLTVCVRVTESGGDRVTSGNEGIKTVSLPSETLTTSSNTHSLTWTNTNTDDQDSSVTVEIVAPNTASCSATNGSYTVSSSDASGKLLIKDDEPTTVELTSSDNTMIEGIAAHTATLTVSLSRQLYAGEVIVVPLTLASSTGARLPGSTNSGTANHDFTVAAAAASGHSGVTIADEETATPSLTFTGHGTNTVQTATVTLTPVAGRSDGDSTPETITATLATDSVLGASGTSTTVSGGAARHASNYMVSLTLAEPGTPGITLSPPGSLRLLETGTTSYTVVLDAAPTHDVTVTVTKSQAGLTGTGRTPDQNAADPSSNQLTFTTTNWSQPQTVTVTGADESGRHRNRAMRLIHSAGSTDSRYTGVNTNIRVDVDDAPELEAWDLAVMNANDYVAKQRPNTVKATRGFRYFQNDMTPIYPLRYQLRLSNRPASGETVTVTATSSDISKFGLSLTSGGTPQASLTVTFEDRPADRVCFNGGHSSLFDVNTSNPDASWACYRQIWVISTQQYSTFEKGCANITHTASGGGLRSTAIGTIRAHAVAGTAFAPYSAPGSDCPLITEELSTGRSAPAKAAPTPTEVVANVQVTAVDDTSASVTWDAVEHATSYDVSWSAESSDALNASAGDLPGITGTTATIDHGASVPMTLTVTVTPEYVDENGDTVQLDDLGTTATLEVGPGSDALRTEAQSPDTQSTQSAVTTVQRLEAAKLCVSDTLMEKTKRYYELHRNKAPGYGANWFAILTAFGERTQADWTADSRSIEPMSSASSRERESKWSGWKPFTEALECVEAELAKVQAAAQAEAQAAEQEAEQADKVAPQVLPDDLTVTLESADSASGVTEGTQVSFTLKTDSAPTKELEVTVTVTQTGSVADTSATGERTVTIPVGKTEAAFTVATIADDTDEVQGSLTATVSDGTGYKTEDQSASVTVAVKDDDATSITLSASADDLTEIVSEGSSEKTLTVTLGRTLIEGESIEVPLVFTGTASLGSDYTLEAPKTLPTGVSYANLGGSDPAKAPTVTFAGSTGGVSSLTATLTLTTVADSEAEDDKETVTVKLGTPATTGLGGGVSTSGNVQFSILEPVPEISITAKTQSVAEGTDAVFTVKASRSSGSDLTVNLTVSESDGSDFVAADKEGTATVTITKGETEADFSVPTVNDSVNEPDGSVTVTVVEDGEKGQYYSQASSPDDSASIKITDNDSVATGPEFSVADETANENVGLMYFTVRLDRSLSQKVQVTFNVRESSPVSARMGQDYFWWWEDGLALTFYPGQTQKKMWVYVYNDNHDEDPETFEVVLSNPTGATAIGDGVAVGTIVNSDPMPAAWLSRFGRTAAQQALDGIAARIESSRTSGIEGSIAGQALVFDPKSKSLVTSGDGQSGAQNSTANSLTETSSLASFDVQHAFGDTKDASGNTDTFGYQSYSMTEKEALLASSFTATEDKDTSGGSLAFWGKASQSNFDGTEGTFSLDGEATTLMSGTDYARGEWLLGIALMQSKGKGGYRDTDTVKQADLPECKEKDNDTLSEDARKVLCNGAILKGSGDVEATLTAAVPYASFDATERLKVWGALGLGTGDVTLKPNVGGKLSSDISWTMAAGGLRGDVISQGSGFSLAVKSDVLWARTTSDKTNQLAASDSTVTRLRFGLEGSWNMALDGNGTLTPKLEAGMRHDGGDAESGFGVELGGSVVWTDPTLGMSLDVSGRTLVTHDDDDLKDSGFAASLIWDPKPTTARGASFTVNLDRGAQAKGGMDALFTPQTIDRRSGTTATSGRWRAQAAYGVAAPGGRYVSSPYMGLGLGAGTREYTLGWKITPEPNAPDVSFGLRTTRTESDSASAHHDVRFEAIARW